jgi:hypothetical protein
MHLRHPRPLRGRIRTNHQPGQVSHLADSVHGRGRRAGSARVSVPALTLSMSLPGRTLLDGATPTLGRAWTSSPAGS